MFLDYFSARATISNAIVTVGMGEVGSTVQSRTIETTTIPLTANGFVASAGWISQIAFGATDDPRIGTTTLGASISFSLTSASGFYIVGSVNSDHGLFDVTVTPSSGAGPQQYNGSSQLVGLNTTLFLATGLDSSQTYQVEMKNDSPGLWLDTSNVVVFDTSPSPQSSALPSQSSALPQSSGSSQGSSKHLGIGVDIGIAVGAVFVLLTFVVILFCFRLRWRRDMGPPASFTPGHLSPSSGATRPASYIPPSTWVNYPPTVQSGNSSAPLWAVDQYGRREERWSPAHTHSDRTWPSGSTVDYSNHQGQPQVALTESGLSRPSTSTEWRLTNMSDRSSVPHIAIDQNKHRVASPPPPAYGF